MIAPDAGTASDRPCEPTRSPNLCARRGPIGSTCSRRSLRSTSGGIGRSIHQTPVLLSALGWSRVHPGRPGTAAGIALAGVGNSRRATWADRGAGAPIARGVERPGGGPDPAVARGNPSCVRPAVDRWGPSDEGLLRRRAFAYRDVDASQGVIPAKAGTQVRHTMMPDLGAAFAGMTTFDAIILCTGALCSGAFSLASEPHRRLIPRAEAGALPWATGSLSSEPPGRSGARC
jgi:hypothetical protein